MNPKYVSAFLVCFIFGVGIASVYLISENIIWMSLLGGTFLVATITLAKKQWGITFACMIIGASFGVWYVNQSFQANEYQLWLGESINVEGIIVTDPVMNDKNQQVTLLPNGFHQYFRASLYTEIPNAKKGDRVWIRGQLELPENFSDFDYIGYLQRWNVYAVLKKPRVIVIKRAPWSWRTPLLDLREFVIKQAKVFPNNEGSLIVGMLIGQRQHIPEDVSKAFKTTGLTHIVAVSGFNMSVIATACGALVWYIGRRNTNILTIVIVFGFVVITGASAAVVRAAIMSVIMVMAQLLGRQYASMYSLLVVASIMILVNPRILIWDVGFQLSVAATYGVLIAFRVKRPDAPNTFLNDLLRPTMGAIALTSPIIAYHFETFSVIAPVANMLVLPFVSWIMLFGALSLLPVIGNVFVIPAQYLTSAVLFIAQKMAKVPYANIEVHLSIWIFIAYYIAVYIYIYSVLQKRANSGKI